MNAFEQLHPARAVIAGDWHANPTRAREAIRYAAEQGIDVILHVGDLVYDMAENWDGSPNFLDQMQQALEEAGVLLGWVDGNHDHHGKLADLVADHGHTAIPMRSNVYYLPRGYRWEWCGTSFLALGGAHSVDRPWRRPHVEWWPGETIGIDDAHRACEGGRADVMTTHDVPAGVHIPAIEGNPLGFPKAEIEAAELNRRVLRSVVDVVQPKRLFAGHYHCRLTTELAGDGYTTLVDILDADFAALDQNVTILDIAHSM